MNARMTLLWAALVALTPFALTPAAVVGADDLLPVGAARIDITPDGPIRLTGYAGRKTESEGVAQRLWAKALALGGDALAADATGGDGPAVLITVDNCGVPGELRDEVARRLKTKAGIKSERFVVCSSHIHSGPWLVGFARALLSEPLPPEQLQHMQQYGRQLADKMEQVALAALAARKPARLARAEGSVGFAMNRRPIKEGRCPGLGVNPAGPVDHSLPLLCASDAQGQPLAIVVNYACHCTTIGGDFNRIHGDWAGVAQELIEAQHPGAVAMVCIGCGGDANPDPAARSR